jgi:maleamate amidohydrolase
MNKLDRWSNLLSDADRAAYEKGGFGRPIGFGKQIALLNIDTTHMFVDPNYALCARRDAVLLGNLHRLTEWFRAASAPIYYSRRDDRSHPTRRGIWNLKLGTAGEFQYQSDPNADAWPTEYGPRDNDLIVLKNKPSCFHSTSLESWLRYDEIDTLVVMGTTTSGCVRAAVVDAFSHNFRVIVAEDACSDRAEITHEVNLFDMDMKYADVMTTEAILTALDNR